VELSRLCWRLIISADGIEAFRVTRIRATWTLRYLLCSLTPGKRFSSIAAVSCRQISLLVLSDVSVDCFVFLSSVFDSVLYRPPKVCDIGEYVEVQAILRDEIVNPLRKYCYVTANHVMRLRYMLDKCSRVEGLVSEEKGIHFFRPNSFSSGSINICQMIKSFRNKI
jgi:hypothetical protein